MKFTDYIKEEFANKSELSIVSSFIEALKSLPASDILNKFDHLKTTVKKEMSDINDLIDSLEFDIQNINNSLAQEVLNQKEQERNEKIEQRKKMHSVEKGIDSILPLMRSMFTNIDTQKKAFNISN
jgi:hypothetical protein